ncbi:MAG: CvpA family protein [Pseudomonadales bacterium]|nr:CvpA family protein [Pseudomonadales bacterium]
MIWVDTVILAIIVISAVFGLWRGLIREVLSIIAWVLAIAVARFYSADLAPVFNTWINSESIRYVLAFALLCIATLLLAGLINHFMAKLISFTGLKSTDKLLGALFGVARGFLIMVIVLYFTQPFYQEATWWQQSMLIPYGSEFIDWVLPRIGATPANTV